MKACPTGMLAQTQHAVEGNARIVAGALIDGNAVDDVAGAEVFERPEKMVRRDTKHRGTDADAGIKRDDFAVLQFLAEAIDQVDLRADGPLGAGWRSLDGFEDALGRTDLVGGLGHFKAAFRMDDHADAGMLAADALDLLRREALVHRAVALPENNARVANLFRRVHTALLVGSPNDHFVERDAHAIAAVAAEVLVGEEKNFLATFESPLHDRGGVGTGTNRATVLTGEGFDSRGRVHVSDGDDLAIAERGEFAPAGFHLADVCHVRHGAPRVQIRQNHDLVFAAEDLCAFRHEMNTTENDITPFGFRGLKGELQRVAAEVGELDDFVSLIVMAQNHDVFAEAGFCGGDTVIQRVVRDEQIRVEIAAAAGFDFRRADRPR